MIDTPSPSHELLFSLGFWLHLGQNPDASHLAEATSRERPLAIPQDNISIYKKIIHAITMSISYFLAGTDYYVPLSSNLFLGPRPAEDYTLRHDAESWDSTGLLNTFYLEVQWLPCGSLLIYSYPDPEILRHSLVEVHSTHDRYPEFEFQLAPFGTVATQYYQDLGDNEIVEPTEETVDSNEESRLQSLKPSISWLLEQHGLQLSEHCEWLRVNIRSPVNEPSGKHSGEPSSGTILWPAHLCFYEDNGFTSRMHSHSWLWAGLKDSATDPLKAAETWFLEKDMRDKAIEQKRVELEAQLRLVRQDKNLDDDELLSTGFPFLDRHIDIQGATGIYPTPPDGFQIQPLGHGPDRGPYDPTHIRNDIEMLDIVESQSTLLEHTDQQRESNTETGMSLGPYEDIEDDDLFGDMDSAMFTAKGITEDDFDFFDEPEELSGYDQSNFDPNPLKRRELTADPTASQTFIAKPSKLTEVDATLGEVRSAADLEGVILRQTSPAKDRIHIIPESSRNQSPPQLSSQSIKVNLDSSVMPTPIHELSPSHYTTLQRKQTSGDQLSVFGNIPLWEASRNLDQKYKDRGRFSIDVGKRESDSHREQARVDRFIPLLSQLARKSDDGLDSDEG